MIKTIRLISHGAMPSSAFSFSTIQWDSRDCKITKMFYSCCHLIYRDSHWHPKQTEKGFIIGLKKYLATYKKFHYRYLHLTTLQLNYLLASITESESTAKQEDDSPWQLGLHKLPVDQGWRILRGLVEWLERPKLVSRWESKNNQYHLKIWKNCSE